MKMSSRLLAAASVCVLSASAQAAQLNVPALTSSSATIGMYAFQNTAGLYFSAFGITGASGLYQADVGSDLGLVTHVINWPSTQAVTQSGIWAIGRTWTLSSGTDSINATISGTLPAGTITVGAVTVAPLATGGYTPKQSVNFTTPVTVQSGAHQMVRAQCDNLAGAGNAYVEIFDATSVTLGTTSYVDFIPMAPGGTGGFTLSGAGVQYSTGIMVAAVATLGASTATTAVNCAFTIK